MTRDQLYTIIKIENFNKEIIKKTERLGEYNFYSGIATTIISFINVEMYYEIHKNSLPITPKTLLINAASVAIMVYIHLRGKKIENEIDKTISDKEEYIKTL